MSYLVLARKYRPQTFDEVVKQEHVTRTLTNAISSERVAHAILFSGPRGTGKTTVARILAKAMNCKEGPTPTPCNVCSSCKEITTGNAVDVFEIDGASNNSVDQIRELRENVKYMPAHSLYKIYIIDEVHMLSIAAFNALLKTLEEPPPHIMFMFATTEPHKIPVTILSRCQRHDFRRIDIESIATNMEMICKKENIHIPMESLWPIAREAGGSIRDALSLLDQVMTCTDETTTTEQILDLLGVIERKLIFDISSGILHGDIPRLLSLLDDIYSRGYDIKKLYSEILGHFRNLLILKIGKNVKQLIDLPSHEIRLMQDQVKDIHETYLNQILDLLFKEEASIRLSLQPKLALEVAFIRLKQVSPALPIDLLIEKLDTIKQEFIAAGFKEPEGICGPGHEVEKKPNLPDDNKGLQNVEKAPTPREYTNERSEIPPVVGDGDKDAVWKRLQDIISENYPWLAANLTKCRLKKLTERSLEIVVEGNGFNVNVIKRNKSRAIIQKACEDFFGKKMDLIIHVQNSQNTGNQKKKNNAFQLKQEALNHPLVADAIEMFNGTVVDVKLL